MTPLRSWSLRGFVVVITGAIALTHLGSESAAGGLAANARIVPVVTTSTAPTSDFTTVEVWIDSRERSLAAWQVRFETVAGDVGLVGIESGDHAAFPRTGPVRLTSPDARRHRARRLQLGRRGGASRRTHARRDPSPRGPRQRAPSIPRQQWKLRARSGGPSSPSP